MKHAPYAAKRMKRLKRIDFTYLYPFNSQPSEEGQMQTDESRCKHKGLKFELQTRSFALPLFRRSLLHPNQFPYELEPSFTRRLDERTNNRNNRFNLRIYCEQRQ